MLSYKPFTELLYRIINIDNLIKDEKEILKNIINATKGKEKEEIMKLRDIHQDSVNKIIIKMFKEKKGRMLNVGMICENFEYWRYEILEHIRQYTKSDINVSSAVLIQMLYKVTPIKLDELLTIL